MNHAYSADQLLQFEVVKRHAKVIASSPDFWNDGDVNLLPDTDAVKINLLRIRAKAALHGSDCEKGLAGRTWFSHRGYEPFERTLQFVRAHDVVLRQFMNLNAGLADGAKDTFKNRGHYLTKAMLEHPWAAENAGRWVIPARWPSYVAARRLADQWTIGYEEYIGVGFTAMNLRGWKLANTNSPALLASRKIFGGEDNYVDATIAGIIVKRYADTPRRCLDDRFRAAAFAGEPVQWEHLRFFAKELQRVNGRMAETKWRQYVRIGELPDVTFADALAFGAAARHDM